MKIGIWYYLKFIMIPVKQIPLTLDSRRSSRSAYQSQQTPGEAHFEATSRNIIFKPGVYPLEVGGTCNTRSSVGDRPGPSRSPAFQTLHCSQ